MNNELTFKEKAQMAGLLALVVCAFYLMELFDWARSKKDSSINWARNKLHLFS